MPLRAKASNALRYGSHSVTCKQHHICNSVLSICLFVCFGVVCLWHKCIVTKRLKLGLRGFHYKMKFFICLRGKLEDKTHGGDFLGGLKLGWGGFQLPSRGALSRKLSEIELIDWNWSLIRYHMGFQSVQKSITLNDLERSKRTCNHRSGAQRSAHVSFTDLLVFTVMSNLSDVVAVWLIGSCTISICSFVQLLYQSLQHLFYIIFITVAIRLPTVDQTTKVNVC